MYKYENFIGKVLDGRYKILELVGLGGMAFVLKAEDLVMNRIVAIKILNDEYNGNEQAETRFINESKAVAMLSHKNIVSIYDVAIYPDMKYIVMEFLDGITLREYLDNKGVLNWKEACVYTLQILRALEHAHSKGVIHRDIKPQNIILQKNGEIKVIDFGIGKIPNTSSLTLTEKAIGTVYYISPEQASGKKTDYYTDIYAVGVMLYEAVTGKLPFTADNPLQIAMMQVSNVPKDPKEIVPALPKGVSQIIVKAMQKEPNSRFTSAHSMGKAIEWVLRNPDVVFMLDSDSQDKNHANPSAVSIDMIDTGEIQEYGDNEIAEVLGKNKKKMKNKKVKTKKKIKKEKEKKQSRSMFPIILGIAIPFFIVAVIIGVITIINMIPRGPEGGGEVVTYPDLVGKMWSSELESKLMNGDYGENFKVDKIVYAENDDYNSNQIMAQEPVAEHVSKKDENAGDMYFHFDTITVCKKLEDIEVPNVVYYPYRDAELLLKSEKYQLNVETVSENNNDYFEGQIIRTEPAVGSIVTSGDTITLVICERKEAEVTDVMPNLLGLSESQAEDLMKYTNYTWDFESKPSVDGTNKVIAQSIDQGTVSPASTKVTITISVKTEGIEMPSLIGKTYSETIDAIINMSMSLKVDQYSTIYYLDGDNVPRSQTYGLSYSEAVAELQRLGYIFNAPEDPDAITLYQSIPEGTVVKKDEEISFIFGVIEEEP